ncbi:MAG: hypothetical protein ABIE47_02590, partial [Pseudomonadota bacterium]
GAVRRGAVGEKSRSRLRDLPDIRFALGRLHEIQFRLEIRPLFMYTPSPDGFLFLGVFVP